MAVQAAVPSAAPGQGVAPLPPLPASALEQLAGEPSQPRTLPVTRMATRADLDGPRTLSVRITRATQLRSVVQLLIRGTPFSAIVHSSVRGTFAGELRSLTLRQALEAVLFPSNLDYDVRGTVIRVFPRRPATRIFPLDLVAVRRSWQSRSDPGESVTTTGVSDALTEVDQGVRSLLSADGRHYLDRRAGLVQVTDFAERLERVALYLEAVHQRAARQVLLDVQIYRVLLRPGLAALASGPGIVADRAAFMRTLEASGTVQTLASPRFFAMNNEAAMVRLAPDDGQGRPGASLMLTPQISSDGIVQLSVVPRIAVGAPDGSPAAGRAVNESDTVLRMREGETVVFSGFPYAASAHERAEVVVLLTPIIVVPSVVSQAGQR
jgi:type II secretory pathway component GspD/PulD (secretin)